MFDNAYKFSFYKEKRKGKTVEGIKKGLSKINERNGSLFLLFLFSIPYRYFVIDNSFFFSSFSFWRTSSLNVKNKIVAIQGRKLRGGMYLLTTHDRGLMIELWSPCPTQVNCVFSKGAWLKSHEPCNDTPSIFSVLFLYLRNYFRQFDVQIIASEARHLSRVLVWCRRW